MKECPKKYIHILSLSDRFTEGELHTAQTKECLFVLVLEYKKYPAILQWRWADVIWSYTLTGLRI